MGGKGMNAAGRLLSIYFRETCPKRFSPYGRGSKQQWTLLNPT
jgi:hypothetical protein